MCKGKLSECISRSFEPYVCVNQLCLTLCKLDMDCSPPGSSVHGILQARILEWVAIPFSRGSSQCRNQTLVSFIAGRFFTILSHEGSPLSLTQYNKGKKQSVWILIVYHYNLCQMILLCKKAKWKKLMCQSDTPSLSPSSSVEE